MSQTHKIAQTLSARLILTMLSSPQYMKLISTNLVSQAVEIKEQGQVLADVHQALLTTVYEAD